MAVHAETLCLHGDTPGAPQIGADEGRPRGCRGAGRRSPQCLGAATISFGDCAILVDAQSAGGQSAGGQPAGAVLQLVAELRHLDHVEEVLPGAVVCVRVTPGRAHEVEEAVEAVVDRVMNRLADGAAAPGRRTARTACTARTAPPPPRQVELPVCFDGPDLDEVASCADMSIPQVADAIAGAALQVAYFGFAPGFAYMTGLPGRLAEIGRRHTPSTVRLRGLGRESPAATSGSTRRRARVDGTSWDAPTSSCSIPRPRRIRPSSRATSWLRLWPGWAPP